MKKWLIFVLALCLLTFAACNNDNEDRPDWGITLTAKNVTPTGCILICTQSGGEMEDLYTGYDWFLTKQKGNSWHEVQPSGSYDVPGGILGIQKEGTTQWTMTYGPLEPGNYRICKTIMGRTAQGRVEEQTFWAEFTIQ